MQEVKIFGINFMYNINSEVESVDIRFELKKEGTYLTGNVAITKAEYDTNQDLDSLKAIVLQKIESI